MADCRAELTLARGIRVAAARWPDRAAVVSEDREISYRDLARLIARTSNAAHGLGLQPGDRVALVSGNRLDYVAIVAGLSDAGVVVATLGAKLTVSELLGIFADCTPRYVLGDESSEAAREAARLAGIPFLGLDAGWSGALVAASDSPFVSRALETDCFGLAYTSGTTGAPKGVMLTHRSRSLTFMAMAAEYGCFAPADKFLVVTPMSHGAGFVFGAAPLFFGGTSVILEPADPESIAARIAQDDLAGVFLVPTQIARMRKLPASSMRAGAGLKSIISNASALAQPLKEMMIDRLGPGLLHETYGSTEAGIVTNIRPDELLIKPGSVGTPFPLMSVSLRDADGHEVPAGTAGELFVQGPYAFAGYWNAPAATAEAMVDGWVTVGDMAVRDEAGFITIVDRKKDMVVTGGINVYPREIELALADVPGLEDIAVVGLPDPEWGERLHGFYVGSTTPATLLAAARARLASHKIPKGFSVMAELPRGATGKVLKRSLRDREAGTKPDG